MISPTPISLTALGLLKLCIFLLLSTIYYVKLFRIHCRDLRRSLNIAVFLNLIIKNESLKFLITQLWKRYSLIFVILQQVVLIAFKPWKYPIKINSYKINLFSESLAWTSSVLRCDTDAIIAPDGTVNSYRLSHYRS